MSNYALEMLNINKRFGSFYANKNINLRVKKGEIHALLGENGAGKSTLMKILFGMYTPTSGEIRINGKKEMINDPLYANFLRIGMVHQHFKLIDDFTVVENIILGAEPLKGLKINYDMARKRVMSISQKYSLKVNIDSKVSDLTVGQQQKVEILKMLYRDADILIFDEPTAVLTPKEINEFMQVLKNFASQGKTVIIITHKLSEIKAVADKCSIIRKGEYIKTVDVKTTTEQELASLMVGREISFTIDKGEFSQKETLLKFNNVRAQRGKKQEIKNISFEVHSGEIIGIAGVEGNGQEALAEAATGMIPITSGKIEIKGKEVKHYNAKYFRENKVANIPSDRHKHGLVLRMKMYENMVLNKYYKEPYSKHKLIQKQEMKNEAEKLFKKYDIRNAEGITGLASGLSGGNQQKAIIARELEQKPDIIVASQPTRGVDVGAIENIHKNLIAEKTKGKAIILISYELDEIIKLSDKIAIIYNGEIVKIADAHQITKEEIGEYMAGGQNDKR